MQKRNQRSFMIRLVMFAAGLFLCAMGLALSVKSDLGTSPTISLPFVIGEITGISVGTMSFFLNVIYLVLQILLLRKEFKPVRLLQLPLALVMSVLIDFSAGLLENISINSYPERLLLCFAGILILGAGVFLTVRADLILHAGEAFDLVLADKLHVDFGKIKIVVDCISVGLAALISVVVFHELRGIREGTVFCAVLVGLVVQLYTAVFNHIRIRRLDRPETAVPVSVPREKPHLVITITRAFGPNSVKIARRLSELTGLKLYDDELIGMVIEDSGLDASYVRENEESLGKGLLYDFYRNSFHEPYQRPSQRRDELLYQSQQRVIKKLAEKEDCIILGRNANIILGKSPDYYHVYLHGAPKWRIAETMEEFGLSEKEAAALVNRADNRRKRNAFIRTGHTWGLAADFNLCLDVARYGVEKSAEIIKNASTDYVYAS